MTKDTKTVGTLQEIGARVGDVVQFGEQDRPIKIVEWHLCPTAGLQSDGYRIISRAAPTYLDGEWHNWHGGECPVPRDVMVEVEWRSNAKTKNMAKKFRWRHSYVAPITDITRFRVVQSNAEGPNSPVCAEEWPDAYRGSQEPKMGVYGRSVRSEVIDVYDVLVAFDVTNPATAHAVKKLLAPGQRGHKDTITDLREAMASVQRAIEIEEEKA